ncbi:hypothetical protein JA1_003179 [Spathaspora sp. JA1]|nr:hypothetical protein JA1_003179 [Spathaspora sp. JA1]
MPLTYSNLIASSNLYTQREAASSSESLDSNASTIKLTSGTPPPHQFPIITTTNTSTIPSLTIKATSSSTTPRSRTIQIPNYYVAPKGLQESDSQDSSSSTSMSSSCSTSSSCSSTSYVMAPRLIRKKSGELVKSSLKLPQLLQRSLSTPQLPARKSVRFASRLTNIKMFDGMESPAAVSSTASTPLHSPPSGKYAHDDDLVDEDDEDFRFLKSKPKVDYFDWNWHGSLESSATSSDDEDEYWSTPKALHGSNSLREYRLTSHNIPKIVNVKDLIVWLPSAYVLKTDGMTYLYGLVNVKNLDFEKKIFIKLSLNNWKTSVIFGGNAIISYVKSIGDVDQFKFKINVDDLISNRYDGFNAIDLQMCIKYEVSNNVYWDNNGGSNYQFKLTMVNGIKSYTYTPPKKNVKAAAEPEEFPQFNELISKLKLHQQVSKSDAYLARRPPAAVPITTTTTAAAPQQQRFSFSVHNNFEDHKPQRPFLKTSFSSSDVTSINNQPFSNPSRPKYSQSFRHRQQKKETAGKPEFSSGSYADLLNNYCFANSTTSSPVQSTTATSVNASTSSTPTTPVVSGCLPSTASTLHSFSDSIHI